MATPFVGEIRMFGAPFAPVGWFLCQGQTLPISSYEALYSLIGTTYGGDGQQSFALPNLQSRVPIHMGTGLGLPPYQLGELGGVEAVTVKTGELPLHSHTVNATTSNQTLMPSNQTYPASVSTADKIYGPAGGSPVTLWSGTIGNNQAGNQPHANIQPFLTINFIIAYEGIYPSRN